MVRWYFVFWYRDAKGATGFKSGVTSTMHDFFPVKHVAQEIADDAGLEDLCITSWHKMSEMEFHSYQYREEMNHTFQSEV